MRQPGYSETPAERMQRQEANAAEVLDRSVALYDQPAIEVTCPSCKTTYWTSGRTCPVCDRMGEASIRAMQIGLTAIYDALSGGLETIEQAAKRQREMAEWERGRAH